MKILVSIALFTVFFSMNSFSQALNQVKTLAVESAVLQKNIQAGSLTFFFNKEMDAQKIAQNASYYTKYFTVNYDEKTGKTVLKFVDKSTMAKKVCFRFLKSNNISEVIVGEKTMSSERFMEQFLQ